MACCARTAVVLLLQATLIFGGPCDNVVVMTNTWPGGWQANLVIPIAQNIQNWNISLAFNAPVTSLQVYNAAATTANNQNFLWTSLSWSGVQNAGTSLTSNFLIYYPTTSTAPYLTSVVFNGVEQCSGSSTATTTKPSTTTSTSMTTKPTTTVTTTKPTTTSTTTTTTKPTYTSATTKPVTTTTLLTTTTTKPTTTATTTKPSTTTTTPLTTTTAKPTTTATTTKPNTTTTTPLTTTTTKSTTTGSTTTTSTTTTTTTKPTTTSSTTTTTISTTTKPSTTTTLSGNCNNAVVLTSNWAGGWQANLNIPITTATTSWTVSIGFDQVLTSFQVWTAVSSTSDSKNFQLVNYSWNGVQSAGTTLVINFLINYPTTATTPPTVNSVVFNGAQICSGSGTTSSQTTTTLKPTTTVAAGSTTTTAAGPTTTTVSTTRAPTTVGSGTTTSAGPTTAAPSLNTKYNYAEVITKSLLFYAAQRSGKLPADNPIPYRGDSALNDKGLSGEDMTGGYYDAGDFVKFGFTMAGMTTVIAWSVIDYLDGYSSAGQTNNAYRMLQWSTDYFIKAHVAPNTFYGQVGDGNADHSYWGRPEEMTMSRPAAYISTSNPGSDLAGETAATLAAVSIVFSNVNATYSALCLSHAKQLYSFAKTYLGIYSNSIGNAGQFYASSGYGDELAWAAAWLYRATNDVSYLNDAISFYNTYGLSGTPGSFDWDNKAAGVQVLLAKLTGQATYRQAAQAFCDKMVYQQQKTPKGLVYISQWGSLRTASNIAFICLEAADLNITSLAYRQFAQKQIHYALGDTGRSYVVGFGTNPPKYPHHRSSSCYDKPSVCDWNTYNNPAPNPQTLWGALVGGPDATDAYTDVRSDYVKNEVACDYNAGFQGAVAALQSLAFRNIFK